MRLLQAVMAAKLGSAVAMISMVGDDVYGKATLDNFRKLQLDSSRVGVTSEACRARARTCCR